MNLDETIKYYVEKAEDCEAIVAQWKEKATEYRQTANYLIALKEMQSGTNDKSVGFTSFKDDTSRLKKFLNHFAPTKLRGDDDEA